MSYIQQRTLIESPKKRQQKYIVLLADHTVIIDNEFPAMKSAVRTGKRIIEMLPTDSRLIKQITGLSKLLESLEKPNNHESKSSTKGQNENEATAKLFAC